MSHPARPRSSCSVTDSGQVEGFTDEALGALIGYSWPGNVRELRNMVEVAFVTRTHGAVEMRDLPEKLVRAANAKGSERTRLLTTFEQTHWNKSKAAEPSTGLG